LSRLALTHLLRGRAATAGPTMRAALRVAAHLDDPMTTGYGRASHAIPAAPQPALRDLHGAVAALESVTQAVHIGYFEIVARLLHGWLDVLDGDPSGVAAIRESVDRLRAEQPLHLSLALLLRARAHLLAGDAAAGRAATTEAVRLSEASGQRYLLPELLRVDAELRALAGDRTGAVRSADLAVETAAALAAPWLRERAAATRGRL